MSETWNDDAYPGTATVFIEAAWGGTIAKGSGALIGRNDVITASHVIYDSARGGSPDWIRVYPSYNPSGSYWRNPNKSYTPAYYSYFTEFDPDGDGYLSPGDYLYDSKAHAETDLALLSFSEPIGDQYGWFGTRYDFKEGVVNVLGYPGAYGNYLTYDSGHAKQDAVDTVIWLDRDIEVNPGNSGGPVYTYNEAEGRHLVGVVSTKSWATSIKQHSDFVNRRMDLNDALIGSQGGKIHRFTGASEAFTGADSHQDLFIFDASSLSKWRDPTIDAIYSYSKGDYLIGPTYFGDDITTSTRVESTPWPAFTSVFVDAGAGGSVFGTAPSQWIYQRKKGKTKARPNPAYGDWVRKGSKQFEPFATAAFSKQDNSGTWLFVNDGISGFDLSKDSVLWIDSYIPTPETPIMIL